MPAATTLRQNIATQLQASLIASGLVDDVFEIVAGKLEGPQVDKDRGSVWVEAIEEDEDDKSIEALDVRLRVFKRFYASRGADLKPYDPAPLEAVGEAVQTSLTGYSGNDGVWYYRVTRQEFLIDEQGVEVSILAFSANMYQTTS